MARTDTIRVAFVGGPMYDPLYESIPAFERDTGLRVDVVAQLPHPELNAYIKEAFSSGDPDLDLLSTHTKYAPSQAQWLAPLDASFDDPDLLPRPCELSRIGRRQLQVPRNLDVRLLHYRRDLIDEPPDTWSDLIDLAAALTRPGRYGFLFPGRDSGLFGTFYEMLVGAGGELFDSSLQPAFDSEAGIWAAERIAELHHRRRVTPETLPQWHYDEISASFRAGDAAMVCDWPGGHHLYRDPAACAVWDRLALAPLPSGPAGSRAAYGGCHSFAIAATAKNVEGASALLRFLTSPDAQLGEARRGTIPCRASALARIREEASADPVEARRWQLLADAEQSLIVPPRFAAYPQCEDAIWHAIQRAMVGEWTPREAVAKAAADVRGVRGRTGVRPGGVRRTSAVRPVSAPGVRPGSDRGQTPTHASTEDLTPARSQGHRVGRVVLVTGAARGIGRATAERFAAQGASVALLDIDREETEAVAKAIRDRGETALALHADLANSAAVREGVERTVATFGRLDVLVSNAGIHFARAIDAYTDEDIERIVAVNLKGALYVIRAAVPKLRETRGSIVSVSSMTGLVGQDKGAAYAATKGAVISLTKALALELGGDGIRVNCVCPAAVDTPLMRSWAATLPDPEAVLRGQAAMHLTNRMADPDEIAAVVVFLASPAASFITGVALPVEGGATLGYRRA